MKNNIALITGSTDGIGKKAAELLALKGFVVVVHGRDKGRVVQTVDSLKELSKNPEIYGVVADFENLQDVEKMAEEIKTNHGNINILVNNAGVFEHERKITKDGLEKTFQVNHLAHFLLTLRLLELLKKNAPSWIINVSSMVHASSFDKNNIQGELGYDGYEAYSLSKLFNVLTTYKLARMLGKDSKVHVYAVHPGVINTKLLIKGWGPVGSDPSIGAKNILAPLLDKKLLELTGIYVMNGKPSESTPISYKKDIQDYLWEYSLKLLKKRGFDI